MRKLYKINDLMWDIKWVKATDKNLCANKDEDVCGITHFNATTIYMNRECPRELIYKTLVHELTHATLFSYGLGQYETFTEENVCDIMDSYGLQILTLANDIMAARDY